MDQDSVQPEDISPERRSESLAHLSRALKSFSLYPEGHPHRTGSLQRAYHELQGLLQTSELVLVISRSGFTDIDGGAAVAPTPMVQTLATELFIRRVKRLVILKDLSLFDLQKFLRLLTLTPDYIEEAGGMEELMARRFIQTIWTNEIDISTIMQKREAMEVDEEGAPEPLSSGIEFDSAENEEPEATIDEIISWMAEETDDDRYRKLSEKLLARAQQLREQNTLEPILPALLFLWRDGNDIGRSRSRRDHAGQTLALLLGEDVIELLLDKVCGESTPESEPLPDLCALNWERVAPQVVQRYLNVEGGEARKTLAGLFKKVGKRAIPALLPLLADEQWTVVLAVLPLVGELGGREHVRELADALSHTNPRVRREAIRTLAKVGGPDAEDILLELLNDRDTSMKLQAIFSLGIMSSRLAVVPLVELLTQRDIFLENLQIKKEAALALGRIGDPLATPHLLRVLNKRHIFVRKRWLELKVLIATALGQLRDPASLEVLKALARHHGRLGKACTDAVESMERRQKEET